MDNASRILTTLDGHLDHPVRLILYGRAAIQLGFPTPPDSIARSLDVDAIIPMSQTEALTADDGFWAAQDQTNRNLQSEGLYITHLFPADMVILRRCWEDHLVRLPRPATRWLELWRPATVDLVLTKMMRGLDELDLADARYLIETDRIPRTCLADAMEQALVPPFPEIEASFRRCRPLILAMAAP